MHKKVVTKDKKKIPAGVVSSSKVLLQINGENASVVEAKSNGNELEMHTFRDADSHAPLVATVSPASPLVTAATLPPGPPPSLTVNESRRKKEDNMAVIFMGFILVFLVCHLPR